MNLQSEASSTLNKEVMEVASRLHEELNAEAVWLFGSHARGDATEDSDYDFLVIVPQSTEERYERAVRARRTVSNIRIPKDVIVLTRAEWERDLQVPASLASAARREGIRLE